MFDALQISATGMQAQQLQVDTIANNLANVHTTGFKRSRVAFADLVVQDVARKASAERSSEADLLAPNARVGAGVTVAQLTKMFEMGEPLKTGSPFDFIVQGDGFVEVILGDGSKAYSRGGTLAIGKDGQLTMAGGQTLKPGIQVPADMKSLIVHQDGRVQAVLTHSAEPVDIGQIELVRFINPQGLSPQGDNLYRATDASGDAQLLRPGEDAVGLVQGVLESSNVKMVDEMVQLVVAQRTYEANAKVVQAADEMMGLVNGLRR